jgi:hypothetical protein
VSSTGTYATSGAVAARAPGNWLVAAVILGLFVLAAVASAARKDVTQGFDEVAHVSYVAQIQHDRQAWPNLASMHLLDPGTFQFTGEANYLNHPPIFYALLAALGPSLEGHPQAILALRLIDIALAAIGVAAWLGLALAGRFSRHEFYAFAIPLTCVPVLVPLAGAVNNDDLVLLGGAVATLGAWQLAAHTLQPCARAGAGPGIWLAVALAGVVAAAWAKLTGLVLTGTMVCAVLAFLLWHKRLPWTCAIAAAFALALAAAPYFIYIAQYGGPVPNTAAQMAFVESGARAFGWADLPHMSFPGYFAYFVGQLIANWMPTLAPRNAFQYGMLVIPVAALVCAAAGLALSLHRVWRAQQTSLDVVVIAGALALAANFALHIGYSYSFYLSNGWKAGAYPRYYLPLFAIVPLACLSLLAAVEAPRWRNWLLAFFVVGPVLFRVFGAPLG